MAERTPVEQVHVDRLRRICLALPEAHEELAWNGVRWRIRTRTFAHVLVVDAGRPEGLARAAELAGATDPVTVLTFRTPDQEADVLEQVGRPFFRPTWSGNIVGMLIEPATDWTEVAELLTDSFCVQAPARLAARVDAPPRA
ncbi:MAG: MmcQ/YjbR family DNA-binding protein [Nocardioides sp.]|nr:MmcQ/YjbR family DNA-binding protein [Nocardioides sp.]